MKRKIHSYSSVRFTGTLNRLREIFFRRKLMLKAYHDKTISLLRKINTLSFTLYFVAEKEADLICPGRGGGPSHLGTLKYLLKPSCVYDFKMSAAG